MGTILEAAERDAVEHDRTAFNLAVWEKVLADPELAKLPYRIETDEFGRIIMSPPPAPSHGSMQSRISWQLRNLIAHGEVISECPISTRKGVKAADVAWCSEELWADAGKLSCFPSAPQICVEVISPGNTKGEIEEKPQLYFEGGAKEVWLCSEEGEMTFLSGVDDPIALSVVCPEFPRRVARGGEEVAE